MIPALLRAFSRTPTTVTDYFTAKEQHQRMTQEFLDFAKIIDEKDYETAHELLTESVTVVGVLLRFHQRKW